MTTKQIGIKEASFENMVPYANIGILGKRRTGKTTWAQYICQYIPCDRFLIVCGNEDCKSEWKREYTLKDDPDVREPFVPPMYIIGKDVQKIEEIVKYQYRKCSKYTQKHTQIPQKDRLCIVFDDCGSDKKFMHDHIVKDLNSNGRHAGIYMVWLLQYLMQKHPQNREQLDYVGVLFTANQKNIKKLYDEYVGICELRDFEYILKYFCSNHGMTWIDNTGKSAHLQDMIYSKRLLLNHESIHPLGSPKYRSFAKIHYAPYIPKAANDFSQSTEIIHDEDVEEDENQIFNDSIRRRARHTFEDKKGRITIYCADSVKLKQA